MDNLFDCGGPSQTKIIRPYMNIIRRKIGTINNLNPQNCDFFLTQLESCIAKVCEHEIVPNWVKDIRSYRLNSEIFIFLSLFGVLDIPESEEDEHQEIVSFFYEKIKEFGEKRKWDQHVLHIQFIRTLGVSIQTYLSTIVGPIQLSFIDYN